MQLYTPGTSIAQRYRITRLLGSGGASAVYEACDTTCDAPVALKQNGLPQWRAAWTKAAHALAGVQHPNLPSVVDVVATDDSQFLVSEYIAGPDLEELLQLGGALPTADVLRWAEGVLDALVCLHQQRPALLHGAIRPRHLKLTGRGRPLLLDPRLLQRGPLAEARHADPYTAPELLRGGRGDARSDVYALAATLYHLLAGVPPIDAATRRDLADGGHDPLLPIGQLATSLPALVGDALHMGLALDPQARPATAAAFQSVIRQAVSGRVPVLPEAPKPRWWSWRR